MATNINLFDSLTNLLSHCFNSNQDIATERREATKIRCIEAIQDDRRKRLIQCTENYQDQIESQMERELTIAQ